MLLYPFEFIKKQKEINEIECKIIQLIFPPNLFQSLFQQTPLLSHHIFITSNKILYSLVQKSITDHSHIRNRLYSRIYFKTKNRIAYKKNRSWFATRFLFRCCHTTSQRNRTSRRSDGNEIFALRRYLAQKSIYYRSTNPVPFG